MIASLSNSFMASANTNTPKSSRPHRLSLTRSVSRSETKQGAADEATNRPRASTVQNGAARGPDAAAGRKEEPGTPDTYDTPTREDSFDAPRASVDMDDIPIELISLIDSFIDSLSQKRHNIPPSIENISRLFQEFYILAATHINTHIASLSFRQQRESSPAPSMSSRASAASLLRAKAASLASKEKPRTPPAKPAESEQQQMLTPTELADRKKARKALEAKRVMLEEAVERRLCEGVYPRLYRHASTQDEAQDDKLRSKTAALAVVGIGLGDLGVDISDSTSETDPAERAQQVYKSLDAARKELVLMNESKYPLGKLNRLKACHKAIVDTLTQFHPSSSADEIMPMLIYTLITLPPENLNVISDLHFIQYFRAESKLVGETAYCLTNLEAAISFLETVDLSTLRADEGPAGPLKPCSRPTTPRAETFPPAYASGLSTPSNIDTHSGSLASVPKPLPSPSGLRAAVQLRNRRLSDLVNTPAQAFGAASDAVFSTADQSIKTISNSLGDSYKFLIGRLRQENSIAGRDGEDIVPKTLDDARKLISTPPPGEDDGSASGASSIHGSEEQEAALRKAMAAKDDRVLNLISGRKLSRDHSSDSLRSAGSASKRVGFTEDGTVDGPSAAKGDQAAPGAGNPALMESMRNLGSSLNPMARIAGIGGFRGFGRTVSTPAAPLAAPSPPPKDAAAGKLPVHGGDLATAFPDIAAQLPPKEMPKIAPPVKRFMELQNPTDLKIGEVLELLRDYRRLAGALKEAGAFKE